MTMAPPGPFGSSSRNEHRAGRPEAWETNALVIDPLQPGRTWLGLGHSTSDGIGLRTTDGAILVTTDG
jgi:hypothetical protein